MLRTQRGQAALRLRASRHATIIASQVEQRAAAIAASAHQTCGAIDARPHPLATLMTLQPSPSTIIDTAYLLRALSPQERTEVGRFFVEERVAGGEVILEAGQPGVGLCLIASGAVRVMGPPRKARRSMLLGEGDHLGEAALVRRAEPFTAIAETPLTLLRLPTAHSASLLTRAAHLRPSVLLALASRRLALSQDWEWLGAQEAIHLATRRSKTVLALSLILPSAIAVLSLGALAMMLLWRDAPGLLPLPLAGLGVALLSGGWVVWDWLNDLFLATNQRLIVIERLPLIYEDRTEAPLRTLLSVEVDSSAIKHWLGFGSVVARTFTRPVILPDVPDPYRLAQWIEALGDQLRARQERMQRAEIESAIGQRLDPSRSESEAAETGTSGAKGLGMRVEMGDRIIYRKDAYFLVNDLAMPLAVLVMGGVLLVLQASGSLSFAGWIPWLVAGALLAAGLGWGAYEVIDWANDLYMVTPDQIIALHRTPLGREDRRAASLGNILSLEYDRPGLMARLMNFGNVIVTVGNVSFVFDRVHDPVGVQEDIYRRMEAHRARREQEDRQSRGEEIAEWLDAYHHVTQKKPNPTGGRE
ncbi:MAG: cyclic nucleotide-binding domain-containing protein [Chloroflexi bacterium]|nr:cyclic nucleotide-binding domain-containing protein [Chloroflexota bacterium]